MKQTREVTLLIVDDEPDLREAIAQLFQMDGFNVLTATSGNEALEVIKARRIDLVLSDIQMPNGNGLAMLDEIKRCSDIPIVMFITGYVDCSNQELRKRGASAIFFKPFNHDDVLKAVKKAVGVI